MCITECMLEGHSIHLEAHGSFFSKLFCNTQQIFSGGSFHSLDETLSSRKYRPLRQSCCGCEIFPCLLRLSFPSLLFPQCTTITKMEITQESMCYSHLRDCGAFKKSRLSSHRPLRLHSNITTPISSFVSLEPKPSSRCTIPKQSIQHEVLQKLCNQISPLIKKNKHSLML